MWPARESLDALIVATARSAGLPPVTRDRDIGKAGAVAVIR